MSRRGTLSAEERIEAVQEYLEGKGSYWTIVNKVDSKIEKNQKSASN